MSIKYCVTKSEEKKYSPFLSNMFKRVFLTHHTSFLKRYNWSIICRLFIENGAFPDFIRKPILHINLILTNNYPKTIKITRKKKVI